MSARPINLMSVDELEAHAFSAHFPLHATADYMYAVVGGVEFRAYFVTEVTC